eukprot:scaffold14311_cov150-Skeletonema_dohrnii-CCMP3373.AAC.5
MPFPAASVQRRRSRMSTKSQATMAMAAPSDGGEVVDDICALIYRESQLRKAEAAAAAAERKKTSSASTHHRTTSTRKRTPVEDNKSEEPLPGKQRKGASKRKKREPSLKDDQLRKKATRKQYRKECSADGCTNKVVEGGVCVKHGAKKKRCSFEGCNNVVVKGGVCIRHGAKWSKKKCSIEGCTNNSRRGGVCRRHEAYRATQDESTAFGSEFDITTETQSIPTQRASRATVREGHESERSSVPGEVAILCQEIVEV